MQDRAISLNAVKDLVCRICMESKICYRSKETCVDLRLFDKLPPATSQEKIGHWVDVSPITWKCSKCGYGVGRWNNTNFCPNCGTKMVEPQERGIRNE